MTYRQPEPRRRLPVVVAALLVVGAAIALLLVSLSLASSASPPSTPQAMGDGGRVDADSTVFDDTLVAVTHLDPDLRGALRRATADAEDDGITLYLTSGWRSKGHQSRLLREATAKYGSEGEAARWVATPDTSPHVSGDAVDIGLTDGMSWLSQHGASYGLCQVYGNEPWHFELREGAADSGCPPPYADPTQDPRMHG